MSIIRTPSVHHTPSSKTLRGVQAHRPTSSIASIESGSGSMTDNNSNNTFNRTPSLFDGPNSHDVGIPSFPISLLALNKVYGLGMKGIYKLASLLGNEIGKIFLMELEEVWCIFNALSISSSKNLASEVFLKKSDLIDLAEVEFLKLSKAGIKILSPSELPRQMREADSGPKWLFVEGNWGILLEFNTVGVVGTRNPSQHGLDNTRRIARCLGGYDLCIVSGLAEGIDDEIHRSTMDRGLPNIAFLGHGINKIFPASTSLTRGRILKDNGAVATEYFPDDNFQKSYFVQRNRLQALQSKVVIFVEAKIKSGTAHTLNFAQDYKKSIVGIRNFTPGLDTIIEELGHPVIDLSNNKGMKQLDAIIRSKMGANELMTKPIDKVIKYLEGEIKIRAFSPRDLKMLTSHVIAASTHAMEEEYND